MEFYVVNVVSKGWALLTSSSVRSPPEVPEAFPCNRNPSNPQQSLGVPGTWECHLRLWGRTGNSPKWNETAYLEGTGIK